MGFDKTEGKGWKGLPYGSEHTLGFSEKQSQAKAMSSRSRSVSSFFESVLDMLVWRLVCMRDVSGEIKTYMIVVVVFEIVGGFGEKVDVDGCW